ncbi:TPA: magnesium chelatase [Candidatus Nomurabacteria bacterium]|uniref:AAA+ ATPase domain-containing protein n=2 Tax=Candidatus Nomuraibacteriota TaxID=1752729 RepID=A0A1F6YPS6_9BACT|nr:MAG: Mg chelatase, subunit ChlI [Parcubacteria group bacterium GW2011_GWC1_42_21]KKS58450.1 MAG: Mg chelatase, subunit ChlI [Candidatus Nomurabacteria bacterium GW2011_GWF1_42_40]KKT00272.1 MAG: Mg chelatase, subunit ChlI [Candidatus Nomurabacteria bacterium GW2011_GWA1_43_17]KKT08076.1 MAG: Mg chelatase, subunit ChlI [Candidatus Nomurabacteria bacterium GW2011_GWB1_43_19]KKT11461.1 MAG: Mg chelatase, subunit ChlI [Candidatus Nomurabacteria bacterium GW2011_GWF2_43_24]KKT18143.1 MAG: Mg che
MSFAKVYSAQVNLLKGAIVTIEVDISKGTLHAFNVVGLPDKAVDESKDRVSGAIKNSGYKSPKAQNQKIIVSLSPADLKKEGPFFDLGIALSYMLASGDIKFNSEKKIFLGELGLDGTLRRIRGALPLAQEARRLGFEEIYLPKENAAEAALVEGIKVFGASSLKEVAEHLAPTPKRVGVPTSNKVRASGTKIPQQPKTAISYKKGTKDGDFSDVRGQEGAKRGLEIAAAGGHNIAMYGPPGTGKTMLARAFSQLLPDLGMEEVLEITGIHSVAGNLEGELVCFPPFRAPHHTSSYVAIIGGGTFPKPGEVTLAHRGVLFLDEFPEFEKRVIESLRQPLEDNIVSISRAKGTAIFPSNFILVAAMNPCPCGNLGSKKKECVCKPSDLDRYRRKLSGPIMDRIDLWVSVGNVDYKKLGGEGNGERSEKIKARVMQAREIQKNRFSAQGGSASGRKKTNSEMNVKDLSSMVKLSLKVRDLLDDSAERLGLSARAYHRVIKIARTIADLESSSEVESNHILEAIQYRPKVTQ